MWPPGRDIFLSADSSGEHGSTAVDRGVVRRLVGLLGEGRGASALVVVLLVALGFSSLTSPPPQPTDAPSTEFSALRAMEHVEEIAREPHPMGSAENVAVRRYIVRQLSALGLDAETQEVVVPDYFRNPTNTVQVVNVMARLEGADSTGAIVLMAHYDSALGTPGANDNAAAVAAVLEVGRIVTSIPQLRNDVILLLTDGEEPPPRFGASAFVAEHPWFADVGMVVNFEAIGGSGPSMLLETGGSPSWVIDGWSTAASRPVAFSFLSETVELLGGADTDFAPFLAEGVPGLNFVYLRGSPIYHTRYDSPDRVDLASLQHHGDNALATTVHFGNVDLAEDVEHLDSIYFTLSPWILVQYQSQWAVPLSILVAAFFLFVVVRQATSGSRSVRAIAAGIATILMSVVVAALLSVLLWRAATGLRSMPGVAESYAYLSLVVAFCSAVIWGTNRAFSKLVGMVDLLAGAAFWWVGLSVLTALTAPGASYLFIWPSLAVTITIAWSLDIGSTRWQRMSALLLLAGSSLLLLIPAVDTYYQLTQPRPGNTDSQLSEVMGVVAALVVLVIALIGTLLAKHPADHTEWSRHDPLTDKAASGVDVSRASV